MKPRLRPWRVHVQLLVLRWLNAGPVRRLPPPQGPRPLQPDGRKLSLVRGILRVGLPGPRPPGLVTTLGVGEASPFGNDYPPHKQEVAGCLAHQWEGWLKIGAEEWTLCVLREGYRIPFSSPPPLTSSYKTTRSYVWNSIKGQALRREILQLWDKGAIEEVPPSPGFYSHVFVVPKVTGGFRPIIDLSILNKHVVTTKFKMETVRTVMSAIRQGDWMVSLDLQDAYLQVPIHPDSCRFLRFVWEGRHLQF